MKTLSNWLTVSALSVFVLSSGCGSSDDEPAAPSSGGSSGSSGSGGAGAGGLGGGAGAGGGQSGSAGNAGVGGALPPEPDFGGFRPDYPPVAGYDTRAAFGAGDPAIWIIDTLSAYAEATPCTGTCEGLLVNPTCDNATCFRSGLATFVQASGPKVAVCTVSGNIDFGEAEAYNKSPHVLMAMQTCPSPGVTIVNGGIALYDGSTDVVIQHLRIRPGDGGPVTSGRHDGLIAFHDNEVVENYVFDHVTVSWAGNKQIILGGLGNALTWRSMISEALWHSANFPLPNVSGLAMLGVVWAMDKPVSVIESLFAHNPMRNPEIHRGTWNVVNNVIFDWGTDDSHGYPWGSFFYALDTEIWKTSIIKNKYITSDYPYDPTYGEIHAVGTWSGNSESRLYLDGNALDAEKYPIVEYVNFMAYDPRTDTPVIPLGELVPRETADLEAFVLANAGARPLDRDPVDTRVVSEVTARTGRRVQSQNDVGGWPALEENSAPLPLPALPFATSASRGAPYTALEEYLYDCARSLETPGWPKSCR